MVSRVHAAHEASEAAALTHISLVLGFLGLFKVRSREAVDSKVWCLPPPSGASPENGASFSGLRQRCAVSPSRPASVGCSCSGCDSGLFVFSECRSDERRASFSPPAPLQQQNRYDSHLSENQ